MVAIGSISGWKPGRGPVISWTASPASREAVARAGHDPLPPTFQQAQHLKTAHFGRQSGRPVPRIIMTAWTIEGMCDVAAMTEAINTHLRRHDTYYSAFDVTGDDGETITRRTISDPALIEFVPTALGFMEENEIRTLASSATPSALQWDCFTFGVVQKADHFEIYASIDHLHTDGMSAGVIYRDIHLTYHALLHEAAVPQLATAGYRDHTARQRLQVAATTLDSRPIKDWVEFARETRGDWPSFPLNLGEPSTSNAGGAVTVELLDGEETEAFDTACRAAGARFSGGVMACSALANHHLTGAETFHTFTPSDTRGGGVHTAGWYASLFPVTVPVIDGDFAQTARAAQKSFDSNKHLAAVPFARVLELASAEELGVVESTRPSMMVSLMDFRGMVDADASKLGLYIDDLSHGGINMWITRHATQTTITVSFPDTMEARHSVHHYIAVLRSAFTEAAKLTTGWIDEVTEHGFAHSAQLAG